MTFNRHKTTSNYRAKEYDTNECVAPGSKRTEARPLERGRGLCSLLGYVQVSRICNIPAAQTDSSRLEAFHSSDMVHVWKTLEQHFASQSQARLLQTRVQLANLKKSSSSIADYFQRAQSLPQSMSATSHPIKDEDLVAYILPGLSMEYDPLVTPLTTRNDFVSLGDLYGNLLSHDLCLEQHHTVVDLSISTANVAQRNQSGSYRSGRGSTNSTRGYFLRNSNRSRGRGRGRGGHSS
ncbi:uncharacterized protein LOC132185156 [Corylus avellana]|uniref:uncharacterized protein LOC132185156 n=1 Tax=Corylus avellana TaxID=13451 RepID=UPI00286B4E07|nr:uncharacterized protein LOC132185156 [Corylus avellana]